MKSWISLISFILLFALCLSCGGKKEIAEKEALAPNLEETEPNDSQSQALTVTDGTIAQGFIGAKKDQDWYKIFIPPDSVAILRAEVTGVMGINLKMELFDSENEKLIEADRNREGQGEIITNYGLTSGDYFLRVRELWLEDKERKFNDTTAYHCHIYLASARTDVEFESNDKAVKSNVIQANQTIQGYISPYNDVDWYKIMPPQQSNYYLEINLSGLAAVDLQLSVYDPIEALLLSRNSGGKGEGERILNLGIDPDLKYYYLVVQGGKWQTNEDSTYQLTAIFKPLEGKMEAEPNDRMVRSSLIAKFDTTRGFFDTEKDIDWYQLQCVESFPQVARIEAFGIPKVDLKLTLFTSEEEQVWSVNETGKMENETVTNFGIESNTDYFLMVENLAKSTNLNETYSIFVDIARYSDDLEFEPNNQPESATDIRLNINVKGFIHPQGDVDYYKLNLSHTNIRGLKLILAGIIKVNTDMVLYDANLEKIAEANTRRSEETETLSVQIGSGVYFIKVSDNDGRESNYRDKYELLALLEP